MEAHSMPYIVVVMADDMDAAKEILKEYHPQTGPMNQTVMGLWKVPDKDAPVCRGRCGSGQSWTRHTNGYMVHGCGKRMPHTLNIRNFARGMFDRFGKNLLNRRLTTVDFQNPEGY
jgi:hypothetical protein